MDRAIVPQRRQIGQTRETPRRQRAHGKRQRLLLHIGGRDFARFPLPQRQHPVPAVNHNQLIPGRDGQIEHGPAIQPPQSQSRSGRGDFEDLRLRAHSAPRRFKDQRARFPCPVARCHSDHNIRQSVCAIDLSRSHCSDRAGQVHPLRRTESAVSIAEQEVERLATSPRSHNVPMPIGIEVAHTHKVRLLRQIEDPGIGQKRRRRAVSNCFAIRP